MQAFQAQQRTQRHLRVVLGHGLANARVRRRELPLRRDHVGTAAQQHRRPAIGIDRGNDEVLRTAQHLIAIRARRRTHQHVQAVELALQFGPQGRQRGARLQHQGLGLGLFACRGQAAGQAQLHQIEQALLRIHLPLRERQARLRAADAEIRIGRFGRERHAHAGARGFRRLGFRLRRLGAAMQAAGQIPFPARARAHGFQRLAAAIARQVAADFVDRPLHGLVLARHLRIQASQRQQRRPGLPGRRASLVDACHRSGEVQVLRGDAADDAREFGIAETFPPGIERGRCLRAATLGERLLRRVAFVRRHLRPGVIGTGHATGQSRDGHGKQGHASQRAACGGNPWS
jgi:hypothetical protein